MYDPDMTLILFLFTIYTRLLIYKCWLVRPTTSYQSCSTLSTRACSKQSALQRVLKELSWQSCYNRLV